MEKMKDERETCEGRFFLSLSFVFSLIIILFSINFVSADSYAYFCLAPGQSVDFGELCNPAMGTRTGPTNICIHVLDNGKQCPTSPNVCNNLGLECSILNSTFIDVEPPVMDLTSPVNGSLYTERTIDIIFTMNERSDVYYQEISSSRPRWKRLCTNCMSHDRSRSFGEGLNEIILRAKDRAGNMGYFNVSFFVDSKKPKITRTEPRRGFANGFFEVQFKEENPKNLTLHYGNIGTGYRSYEYGILGCTMDRGRYTCEDYVYLGDYDQQEIEYWFILEDIAGNVYESRSYDLEVDTTFPVLNSLNLTIDGKRVIFLFDITELNFDEVNYIDNEDSRPRWRRLCSRINEDGICERTKAFRDGFHDLSFQILDDAGNSVGESRTFTII